MVELLFDSISYVMGALVNFEATFQMVICFCLCTRYVDVMGCCLRKRTNDDILVIFSRYVDRSELNMYGLMRPVFYLEKNISSAMWNALDGGGDCPASSSCLRAFCK